MMIEQIIPSTDEQEEALVFYTPEESVREDLEKKFKEFKKSFNTLRIYKKLSPNASAALSHFKNAHFGNNDEYIEYKRMAHEIKKLLIAIQKEEIFDTKQCQEIESYLEQAWDFMAPNIQDIKRLTVKQEIKKRSDNFIRNDFNNSNFNFDEQYGSFQKDVDLSTKTIILVNDDKDLIKITNNSGQGDSFKNYYSFDNPKTALEFMKKHTVKVDYAAIDLHMDEMSGVKLVKELKKIDPSLVAFAQTGDNLQNINLYNEGFDGAAYNFNTITEVGISIYEGEKERQNNIKNSPKKEKTFDKEERKDSCIPQTKRNLSNFMPTIFSKNKNISETEIHVMEKLNYLENLIKDMQKIEQDEITICNIKFLAQEDLRKISQEIQQIINNPRLSWTKKIEKKYSFIQNTLFPDEIKFQNSIQKAENLIKNTQSLRPLTFADILKDTILHLCKPQTIRKKRAEIPSLTSELQELFQTISAMKVYEVLYPSEPARLSTNISDSIQSNEYYYKQKINNIHSKLLLLKKEYPIAQSVRTLEKEFNKTLEKISPEWNSQRKGIEKIDSTLDQFYAPKITKTEKQSILIQEIERLENFLVKFEKQSSKNNFFKDFNVIVINDSEHAILPDESVQNDDFNFFLSPREALEYIEKEQESIDCVFSDFIFSGHSIQGDQIAKLISKINSSIPVFLASARPINRHSLFKLGYVGQVEGSILHNATQNYATILNKSILHLKERLAQID